LLQRARQTERRLSLWVSRALEVTPEDCCERVSGRKASVASSGWCGGCG
jgi:hypothetical protein